MRAFALLALYLTVAACDSTTDGPDPGEQPELGPVIVTYTVAITGTLEKSTLSFLNADGEVTTQTDARTFPEEFSIELPSDAAGDYFIQINGVMSGSGKVQVSAEATQEVTPVGATIPTLERLDLDVAEDVPSGPTSAVSARAEISLARVVVN